MEHDTVFSYLLSVQIKGNPAAVGGSYSKSKKSMPLWMKVMVKSMLF